MKLFPIALALVIPFGLAACEGPVGPQGPEGKQGAEGAAGAKGEAGVAGVKGDKGDKGDRGEKGDKGDRGDKGERGDRGEPALRLVEGTGSVACGPDEVIVSAYCHAPRGEGSTLTQFSTGDSGTVSAACGTSLQKVRAFCMKQ